MANTDIWPTVHAERKALVTDLSGLSDSAWTTQSLCGKWTVRDVVAHMTATARKTPASFFANMIGSGFSFERMAAKDIATEKGGSTAETLSHFESIVDSRKHPPGPTVTWLGETLIHSEDIRRSLGISHDYPIDAAITVADFYKGSNLIIGSKKRIDGVRLEATDASWSHGSGPAVSGPIMSILMAMTGRKVALDDLAGDGVEVLRSRN